MRSLNHKHESVNSMAAVWVLTVVMVSGFEIAAPRRRPGEESAIHGRPSGLAGHEAVPEAHRAEVVAWEVGAPDWAWDGGSCVC
jgi:hypothetical protein